MDTRKVTVRIVEESEGHRKVCHFDGSPWTLGEVLQWTLSERDASYNWTLGFWQRDFREGPN